VRSFTKKIIFLILIMLNMLAYQNCSNGGPLSLDWGKSSSSAAGSLAILDVGLQAQALSILQTNCSSCHTTTSGPAGVFGFNNPTLMINMGLVVAGSPNTSPIFTAISSGVMPPSGALSASDQAVMYGWILGTPGTPPTTTPANPAPVPAPSSGSSSGSSSGTVTTFPAAVSAALNSCTACHGNISSGATTGSGGIYGFDSLSHMETSTAVNPTSGTTMYLVAPGSPSTSALYLAVTTGGMPQGGTALTAAQLSTISSWITSLSSSGSPSAPPPTPAVGTFAYLQSAVFTDCVGCHSGSKAPNGIQLDTYANVIKTSSSDLLDVVSGTNPEMPPKSSSYPKLTTTQLNALKAWINAGKPNN
jgi:mono/diheme cytochrome c family protein